MANPALVFAQVLFQKCKVGLLRIPKLSIATLKLLIFFFLLIWYLKGLYVHNVGPLDVHDII